MKFTIDITFEQLASLVKQLTPAKQMLLLMEINNSQIYSFHEEAHKFIVEWPENFQKTINSF